MSIEKLTNIEILDTNILIISHILRKFAIAHLLLYFAQKKTAGITQNFYWLGR